MKNTILFLFVFTFSVFAKAEFHSVPEISGTLNNLTRYPNSSITVAIQISCTTMNPVGYGQDCGEKLSKPAALSPTGHFVIPAMTMFSRPRMFRSQFDIRAIVSVKGASAFTYRLVDYSCPMGDIECRQASLIKELSHFTLVQIPTFKIIPEFSSGLSPQEFVQKHKLSSDYGIQFINIAEEDEEFDPGYNIMTFIKEMPFTTIPNYFLAINGQVAPTDLFKINLKIEGIGCSRSVNKDLTLNYSVKEGARINGRPVNEITWPMNDIDTCP